MSPLRLGYVPTQVGFMNVFMHSTLKYGSFDDRNIAHYSCETRTLEKRYRPKAVDLGF